MDEGIKRLIELGINASPALRELEKLGAETAKQTDQLNGLQGTLNSFGKAIGDTLKGLAIWEITKQFVEGFMAMAEAMDALDESAQQIGTTVEEVQKLQYAMSFSGVSQEQAVTVMGKFADKLAAIDDASSDTSRKLREMGITAGDDVPAALEKLAKYFEGTADGVNKTAFAIEVFGKNLGLKMIPFLNTGAEGIAKLKEEAEGFGIASAETAAQAAEFNDNLGRLSMAAQGLGKALLAEVLPSLNAFLRWCVDMVGPVTESIKWISKLNDTFSAGAQLAKIWSIATRAAAGEVPKALQGMGQSVEKWAEQAQKDPFMGEEDPVTKWARGISGEAEKLKLIPAKIEAIKKAMATPEVQQNAVQMAFYTKQLKALEDQLDTTEKKRKGRQAKEPPSEWEQWTKSVQKAADTAALVPEKIKYLEAQIKSLDTSTADGRLRLEALNKQLEALKVKDAGDTALAKIAQDAEKLRDAPYVMERIKDEIAEQEAAGKGASQYVKSLREELLKMQAAVDPVAAVTKELQDLQTQTQKNLAMETEYWKRLGEGAGLTHEQFILVNKYLGDTGDKLDENAKKAKDLGDSVAEAGARFVTDWVDQVIDGIGKTEMAFGDMIDSFLKQILKLIANQQMANLLKMFGGAFGGGAVNAGAQGFAFDQRGVQYMASGGILTSPTFFMGGGKLAVAGEAGAEAVMPLQRTASGDLGVAAAPVTVNINNNAPVDVSTQTVDNEDGSRRIEVFIEQKVKGMFTNGSMDRTMRQGYGLTRQPVSG